MGPKDTDTVQGLWIFVFSIAGVTNCHKQWLKATQTYYVAVLKVRSLQWTLLG